MTIKFLSKGKGEILQISVRLKDSTNKIDATSKTGLSVFSKNFKEGSIIYSKVPKNATAEVKSKIAKENNQLSEVEDSLNAIKKQILNSYTNRKEYETINGKWIYNLINPTNETRHKIPNELTLYFEYYLNARKDKLQTSTIKKMKVINNRFKAFQKSSNTNFYLQDINKQFKKRFDNWCKENGYHRNTFFKSMRVLSTICNHAIQENDLILNPQVLDLTKGKDMQYTKSLSVFLSLSELKKIEKTIFLNEKEDRARDWLLISCFTAQRVSDFMRFSVNDIVTIDGNSFLDIKQEKTGTPVLVFLNDIVLNMIAKYHGQFPPLFSEVSKETNQIYYNRLIKQVCKKSGITELVTSQLKNKQTNRMEVITAEKYKFVSSHIGRRSYATNYYGKINTALLMSATGHKSERQFKIYCGDSPEEKAKTLAVAMRKLSENQTTPFKVIKNTANQ